MNIRHLGEELILDKERAVYLPEHQLLVISDLHLGKSAHFRRAGLQVPSSLAGADLLRLEHLILKYKPSRLLITGDMFHHGLNGDIDEFGVWRQQFNHVEFLLVKGNHDRLHDKDYFHLNIKVHESKYCLGPFCFIHHAPDNDRAELYPISGHIHPGVSLIGRAKQRLKFPCFFFGATYAILPAFSLFTGLATIDPAANERIFAITPERVFEV